MYLCGFQSKIDITPYDVTPLVEIPYAVSSWSWAATSALADVGNTEGKRGNPTVAPGNPVYSSRLPGQASGRLTLATPAFDPTDNEFADPGGILPTRWFMVTVWTSGRNVGLAHVFASVTPSSVGQNMQNIASGGAGASLEFETDGEFLIAVTPTAVMEMRASIRERAAEFRKAIDEAAATNQAARNGGRS